MKIRIAAAVAAMTLCLSSPDAFSQGVDMRQPTTGEFAVNRVYDSNETPRRSGDSGGGSFIKREPRVLSKGPLAPSAQDRADHTSFLSQSNTGLIRLLPRRLNNSKFFSSKPAVKIRGDGAYYSFFYQTHEYGYASDLELSSTFVMMYGTEVPPWRQLSVGFAGADFGMLTNLAVTPLESFTTDDPRTEFMRAYKPPRPEPEARTEYRRFQQGVTVNDQMYKSRLPIQVGATYLLRSIHYDVSDVLVAFRVVREYTDQSLIIAWKLLKGFPTPRLNKSK